MWEYDIGIYPGFRESGPVLKEMKAMGQKGWEAFDIIERERPDEKGVMRMHTIVVYKKQSGYA